jgi:hypothetical protein
MVGRKAKSYDMGHFIRIDLPIFQLSATLPKIENYLAKIYEEDFPAVKEKLIKEGYEKIKAEQVDWTYVPRACPLCDQRGGHANLQRYRRTLSPRETNITQRKPTRFKLYYNHSKPKYHQCFIGYLIGSSWQLSKKIDPKKMLPNYHIKKGNVEWFEEPKIRKPKKLK